MPGVMVSNLADLASALPQRAADLGGAFTPIRSFEDVPTGQIQRFIETNGISVEWRRGVTCPCLRADTRRPRQECPHCKGLGHIYPEDRRLPTTVLMSSRQPNGKPWAVGDLVTGTVAFTFLSGGGIPHAGDLIFPQKDGEPTELHEVEQALVRAQNQVDTRNLTDRLTLASSALPKQTPMPERLRYQADIHIDWIGSEAREGASSRIVRGEEGVDLDLVGNEIRWKPGRGPAAGTSYSIRYTAPAAYMIADSTHRAVADVTLPRSVKGIRLDQWDPARDYR